MMERDFEYDGEELQVIEDFKKVIERGRQIRHENPDKDADLLEIQFLFETAQDSIGRAVVMAYCAGLARGKECK